MHRHTMKVKSVEPPPREVRIGRPRYRMTAADEAISRDSNLVAWLAKVHAEKRHQSRPWPQFEGDGLEAFLRSAGVDVERAMKDHKDALVEMPEVLGDLERCIPELKGASFVYPSAEAACLSFERLRRTIRQPGSDQTRQGAL